MSPWSIQPKKWSAGKWLRKLKWWRYWPHHPKNCLNITVNPNTIHDIETGSLPELSIHTINIIHTNVSTYENLNVESSVVSWQENQQVSEYPALVAGCYYINVCIQKLVITNSGEIPAPSDVRQTNALMNTGNVLIWLDCKMAESLEKLRLFSWIRIENSFRIWERHLAVLIRVDGFLGTLPEINRIQDIVTLSHATCDAKPCNLWR